eukprot:gene33778-45231_t
MMPGENGFDFARRFRVDSAVPILMLTARADGKDRINGLEIGVDDYLAKPFEPRELLLRLGNILKRTMAAEPAQAARPDFVRFGPFLYGLSRGELRKGEEPVEQGIDIGLARAVVDEGGARPPQADRGVPPGGAEREPILPRLERGLADRLHGGEWLDIAVAGQTVPFGVDLVFAASDLADFTFHAEICEDFWGPTPPSTMGALAGALICCNLSASNIVIGKARELRARCVPMSSRPAWDGQGTIHELGELLAESTRFGREPELVLADVDAGRLRQERMRNGSFNDAAVHAGHPETRFRRIAFDHKPDFGDIGLLRDIRRFPFVPNTPEKLDADCYEAFNIQVEALIQRFIAAKAERLVIGVSGGLDSTHALIVAAKAMDRLELPRTRILAFTMPGFATGDATKANRRTILKYIHLDGIRSCQLVLGFTEFEPGSIWNTMPPHTHSRRTEIYCYFDLGDNIAMHFMGEPQATRNLVVRDREVVLSPAWSIHCGVGTVASAPLNNGQTAPSATDRSRTTSPGRRRVPTMVGEFTTALLARQ